MAKEEEAKYGCGCILLIFVANLTLGAWTFDYCLRAVLGKDVPWWADAVAGFFLGEFTIPGAILCWILKLAGLPTPFFG